MDDLAFQAEKLRRDAQELVNELDRLVSTDREDEEAMKKAMITSGLKCVMAGLSAGEFQDTLMEEIKLIREE